MSIKKNALECYDSIERERMTKVINAISEGRLVYIRFFEDGSGASFYYWRIHKYYNIRWYHIENFEQEQTRVILMGCCIDKKTFGL